MDLSAKEAFSRLKANKYSRWSVLWQQEDKVKDFPDHAVNRLQADFPQIRANIKTGISKTDKFFTVGSCFAREIEDALTQKQVLATTKTEFEVKSLVEKLGLKITGSRLHAFLNRYNAPSILQELQNVTGDRSIGDALLLPTTSGNYADLHYTSLLQEMPYEECMARRETIRNIYRKCFDASNVFVFTFGLCEAFFDMRSGHYTNITPHPKTIHEDMTFRFIPFSENLRIITSTIDIIKKHKPDATIIITVSPVPLDATFTGEDIIMANMRAKSTLVAAVREAILGHDNVHYFPSYEIVTYSKPSIAWKWDRKHVGDEMVRFIVEKFIEENILS